MTVPVSVVVLTKNEQHNIRRALTSLGWASEVLVIDSGSTDNTIGIVREFANCQLISTPWQGYTKTKNHGIAAAKHDWILWIDADEEVTAELRESIRRFMANSELVHSSAGARLKRLTYIREKAIYHSGWYPGWTLRLFHRRRAGIVDRRVHEFVEVNADSPLRAVKDLAGSLRHFSYPSYESYFRKSVHYAVLSAEEMRDKGTRFSVWRMVSHPVAAFLRQYILKFGFLDGIEGMMIAFGSAYVRFIKYALLYEKPS